MAVSTNKVVKWERGSAELTQTSFSHQFGIWVYLNGHFCLGEFQKCVTASNTNTQTRAYFNNTKRDIGKKKQAMEDSENSPTTQDS